MGKKATGAVGLLGRVGGAVFTLGASEAARALTADQPKPGKLPKDTTEADIAAARDRELEDRRKRRVSLITSPGGAFLTANDLSKPRLLGQ